MPLITLTEWILESENLLKPVQIIYKPATNQVKDPVTFFFQENFAKL